MDSALVQAQDAPAQEDSISVDNLINEEHKDEKPSVRSSTVPLPSLRKFAELECSMGSLTSKGLIEDRCCENPLNLNVSELERLEGIRCDEETLSPHSSGHSYARKRAATDLLPINAEIKKIGVEISEEQAQQLQNDITRLSPVHVSLHEKTLEEVSLTSDTRIFEEQDSSSCSEKRLSDNLNRIDCNNAQVTDEANLEKVSNMMNDRVTSNEVDNYVQVVSPSVTKYNNSPIRQLMVVLSRVDVQDKKSPIRKKKKEESPVVIVRNNIKEEANIKETTTPTRRSYRVEERMGLTFERYSNSPTKNKRFTVERLKENEEFKLRDGEALKVTMPSPKKEERSRAIIEKFDDDEEIVFTSLITRKLDFSEKGMIDAEETETGSDSSEITTSSSQIEFHDCENNATLSEEMSRQESDPLVCDDTPSEIMRRLEPERPEVFTEDSAESLALATGARDEVRSDGSDSGLGSEIPGDLGQTPAPESDSETSFLDKIPDDILSNKEKDTSSQSSVPQMSLRSFPIKSNLKRRLTDCLVDEPDAKKLADEPNKKKRSIQFDAVTVYYFPRAQGFTCVPSQGGSTLGMSATHTHAERFSLSEHAAEQRRVHRARLAQLRSERAANCVTEAASSSEDPSDDTDEEPSDTEELDIDSYYFLQPVPTWQRRALLRAAGVRRIDAVEKDECRDIRASREHCGCGCKGYCDPESCPCSRANVKCQVDRAGFPCGCSRDGCANSSGRIEFNPVRVRTHFIHTLMRLEIEKKQREEDRTEADLMDNHEQSSGNGALRDIGLMESASIESCINSHGGSVFTSLHYENPESRPSQQDIDGSREDSLDLYATRDGCYANDDTVDSTQRVPRSTTFTTFQGPTMTFQQSPYGDYSNYQSLPSTSGVAFQCRGFTHYGTPYAQEAPPCGALETNYDTPFAQDESTGSQYTNLNSVHQPMNAVVHQMGKLEPFSELLAGRYSSYYGDSVEAQNHVTAYQKSIEEKPEEVGAQEQLNIDENCDENFGEIIKKSMVETVSA